MAYTTVYSRINWENEPSINTPINATNLNAIDYAVYVHDQTLSNWDLTKANETDLLLCVKEITYDSDSGEFLFTWQNGTTLAVDLNIEKIPVSFSMSPAGVITMTTEDGTTYTADVGALIKTYTFTDSSVIDFTVVTDIDGNKTVTADIVDGSITGQKLQPNYLADCVSAKTDAETAEGLAEDSAEDSEAWANGTRNGVPVSSTDPAYHNNSKYWSEQSNPTSLVGLTDTDIDNPTNGQTLIYNSTSQKWENQNGGSASLAGLSDVDLTTPTDGQVLTYDSVNQEWVNADIGASGGSNITVTTTEATLYGQNVTISDGVTTLTETFSPSGVALFEGVTMTGQLTIASGAFSTTVNVPYFGNYNPVLSGFTATITVTFPADSTCTCTKSGETQTAYVSPHTFYVHSAGTYTITATDGTHTKSATVVITTDGQSESVTLAYVPDGSTVLPTDDIQTWLQCGGIFDKTTYTTLSDVLSDSTTLSTLINDSNAVDYMVRSTTWASGTCADSTAMTYIGLNNYASNTLLADSDWLTAIANSTYIDSVLNVKVPTMTSDNTPSGECFASGYDTHAPNFHPYNAFDGILEVANDYWEQSGTPQQLTGAYVGYSFTSDVVLKVCKYKASNTQDSPYISAHTISIKGSADKSTWSNALGTQSVPAQSNEYYTIPLTNNNAYRHSAVFFNGYNLALSGERYYCIANYVQFYGRVDV